MINQLTIRKDAEADIRAAFEYYESCRKGLGHEFMLCVEAAFEYICRNPSVCKVVHKDVRRAMIHRFPYGVYFLVRDEKVIVAAVMHARRDPVRWRSRP